MLLHHNWKWVLRPPWSLRHVHIQLWGVGLGRWGRMRNWGYCELVCSFFGLSWLWIFYFIHLQAVFVAAFQQACGASHLGVDHHWASAHCTYCTLHIANRILHIAHCTLQIPRFDAIEFLSHHLWAPCSHLGTHHWRPLLCWVGRLGGKEPELANRWLCKGDPRKRGPVDRGACGVEALPGLPPHLAKGQLHQEGSRQAGHTHH